MSSYIILEVHEWRDKRHGNTYFTARVDVNPGQPGIDHTFIFSFRYGYGRQAYHEVKKFLTTRGYILGNSDDVWREITVPETSERRCRNAFNGCPYEVVL